MQPLQWLVASFLIFAAAALVVLPFVNFAGSAIWLNIAIISFVLGVLPGFALTTFAAAIWRRRR